MTDYAAQYAAIQERQQQKWSDTLLSITDAQWERYALRYGLGSGPATYSYTSSQSGVWVAQNGHTALVEANYNEWPCEVIARHSNGRAKAPYYGCGHKRFVCGFECQTN
jgi:hypothetical protein